jgi:hypothetical protein
MWTASASSLKRTTVTTGPKISSLKAGAVRSGVSSTVGANQ